MSNDIEKPTQPAGFAVPDAFYRGLADVLERAQVLSRFSECERAAFRIDVDALPCFVARIRR